MTPTMRTSAAPLRSMFPCRPMCIDEPNITHHANVGLFHCVPTDAGEYCTVPCETGYLPSGDALCHPETGRWNLVPCDVIARRTFDLEARLSLRLTGLHAPSAGERHVAAQSLIRGLARWLRLSMHLIRLRLGEEGKKEEKAEESFYTAADSAGFLNAELRVLCGPCAPFLDRLRLIPKDPHGLNEAMARSVCADRCTPPGSPGAGPLHASCLDRCPETGGRFRVLYVGEPEYGDAGD